MKHAIEIVVASLQNSEFIDVLDWIALKLY